MLANKKRGEFDIVIKGAVYKIRPTMSLLALLEERFGTLWQLGEKISAGTLSVSALVELLAFLAGHGQKNAVTQEDIFEDILENGAGAHIGAVAGFLGGILSSRVENLNAGN